MSIDEAVITGWNWFSDQYVKCLVRGWSGMHVVKYAIAVFGGAYSAFSADHITDPGVKVFAWIVFGVILWTLLVVVAGPMLGAIRRMFDQHKKPAEDAPEPTTMQGYTSTEVDFQPMDQQSRKNNEKPTIKDLVNLPDLKHK